MRNLRRTSTNLTKVSYEIKTGQIMWIRIKNIEYFSPKS